MKQCGGVWLPDAEEHLVQWMTQKNQLVDRKLTYQYHKLEAALRWVKDWRVAVDVGAHVGLWAMHLAKRFEQLVAFEPVAEFRECFGRNVNLDRRNGGGHLGVLLYGCALGAKDGAVEMQIDPRSTGGTFIKGEGVIPLRKLDDFLLHGVDFLKLDCEGYELYALRGAEETLKCFRPCVVVEQKPHKLGPNFGIRGTPAVDYLVGLGAKLRLELGGDYVLSWD